MNFRRAFFCQSYPLLFFLGDPVMMMMMMKKMKLLQMEVSH